MNSRHAGRRTVPAAVAWLALALSGCTGLAGGPRPGLVAGADWSGLEPVDIRGIDIRMRSGAAPGDINADGMGDVAVSLNEPGNEIGVGRRHHDLEVEPEVDRLVPQVGELLLLARGAHRFITPRSWW